jgi:hypothetical protein
MSKKLITACMALFALAAFILPAGASASPVVTEPTGTKLDPTGKTCTTGLPGICITATNVGETLLKSGSTVLARCTTATMTAGMSKNSGTHVEATIHTTTFAGTGAEVGGEKECTGSFGNITVDTNLGNGTPWCLTGGGELAADAFTVRGGGCAEAVRGITFVLTSTTAGACKYERTKEKGPLTGTFTTDTTGDAILSLASGANTEFAKEEGGFLCPASGSLEMSFTLETDTKVSNDPIWIS